MEKRENSKPGRFAQKRNELLRENVKVRLTRD
jgi:hypothetical protein